MKRNFIREVALYFGQQQILARKLGLHPCNISAWISGKKIIPLHHAIAIEEITEGKFTREMLRPDIFIRRKQY